MSESPPLHPAAAAWRQRLDMEPHPEGGWFRRVFAEAQAVQPADGRGERRALTAIYYLLAAGQHSRWHQVRSAEVWALLDGGPLALGMYDAAGGVFMEKRLANAVEDKTAQPLHAVPANIWQAAYPVGDYALAACMVGPGFDWADFAWLKDDTAALAGMRAAAPEKWRGLV